MNKYGLISDVAEKAHISKKDAGLVVETTLEVIRDALKAGEKVQLVGFGCFEVKERAAREGRSPKNPDEKITIPAMKVPVFKAGKALKEEIK